MMAFPGLATTVRNSRAKQDCGGGARPRHSQARRCAWLGLLAWLILALIPARALYESRRFVGLPLYATIPGVERRVSLTGHWGTFEEHLAGNTKRVIIGQFEAGHPDMTHPMLAPVQVPSGRYDKRNDSRLVRAHATHVAGILVGNRGSHDGHTLRGMAPNAALRTSGWNGTSGDLQAAMQWFLNWPNWPAPPSGGAPEPEPRVRIINMSAGRNWYETDANNRIKSPLTPANPPEIIDRIADEAASRILFVVAAGNQGWLWFEHPPDSGNPQRPLEDSLVRPARGYNLLVVGATGGTANQDIDTKNYRQLAAYSSEGKPGDDPVKPHLVAPGSLILSANYPPPEGTYRIWSGTSMAAPHVAGTAALLHEYSRRREWNDDSRDPKVMRAVLMNSADKNVFGKEVKDGKPLSWLQREAAVGIRNDQGVITVPANRIPLDSQLGAGLLDARQARAQYEAGRHGPGYIPHIGWDFNSLPPVTEPAGVYKNYFFTDPVKADKRRLSATLVWDIRVDYDEAAGTFTYGALDDLDLFLYYDPPDGPGRKVRQLFDLSSISKTGNVEHLFHKLDVGGFYTLEVRRWVGGEALDLSYALAWAFIPEPGTGLILVVFAVFVLGRRRTFGRGAC